MDPGPERVINRRHCEDSVLTGVSVQPGSPTQEVLGRVIQDDRREHSLIEVRHQRRDPTLLM